MGGFVVSQDTDRLGDQATMHRYVGVSQGAAGTHVPTTVEVSSGLANKFRLCGQIFYTLHPSDGIILESLQLSRHYMYT